MSFHVRDQVCTGSLNGGPFLSSADRCCTVLRCAVLWCGGVWCGVVGGVVDADVNLIQRCRWYDGGVLKGQVHHSFIVVMN